MDRSILAVVGGDARQIALANMLAAEGSTVYCSGFEHSAQQLVGVASTDPLTAVLMADIVILPMPPTRDGQTLSAPLSTYRIELNDDFCAALVGKAVFVGMAEKLRRISPAFAQLNLFDYGASEAFLLRNAQATAEGALAPMLRALGGEVSVAARRPSDRAKITALGMHALSFGRAARRAKEFNIIVNTVPARVLDVHFIEGLSPDALLMELASAPGGIDREACDARNVRVVQAPGLPGKYSPLTAAEIIKETVMSILEEG